MKEDAHGSFMRQKVECAQPSIDAIELRGTGIGPSVSQVVTVVATLLIHNK